MNTGDFHIKILLYNIIHGCYGIFWEQALMWEVSALNFSINVKDECAEFKNK